MRNVHFRFPSVTQKRRLHKLSNINHGINNKQKDSNGTIRKIMVMAKNNYGDDDHLQLYKMYEECENKILLLISPAHFPMKKTTRSRTSCEFVTPAIGDRQM